MQVFRRLIVFFWMILSIYSYASAQTAAIDSLLRLLQNARNDTTTIILHYKIAKQLEGYNVAKADKHLEAGYALAKTKKEAYQIAYYFQNKGGLLFDMTKYNESSLYYDSAILLYNQLINSERQDEKKITLYKFGKADCLTGKGLLAAKLYNYQESIQYYLEAIAIIEDSEGIQKNNYMATLYADIASNYYELEQFDEALKFDKLGLPYLNKNEDLERYVIVNLFVADDYSALMQFDSSSFYLEKVRSIVTQSGKPKLDVRFYYILGGIYRKKKEWNNALISFQKANEAAVKMKDDFQVLNSEEGLSACYMQSGDLVKAKDLALHVFNESGHISIPLLRIQALQLLAEIEEKSGNTGKAYQYQKQFIQLSDSIKKEKVQRQMHETETKYQNEKKQKEILLLQKSNAVQLLSLQKNQLLTIS